MGSCFIGRTYASHPGNSLSKTTKTMHHSAKELKCEHKNESLAIASGTKDVPSHAFYKDPSCSCSYHFSSMCSRTWSSESSTRSSLVPREQVRPAAELTNLDTMPTEFIHSQKGDLPYLTRGTSHICVIVAEPSMSLGSSV